MDDRLVELLERQSVVAMESTIPPDMTIRQWRRQRAASRARARRILRGQRQPDLRAA
jgi:hypothetical protein